MPCAKVTPSLVPLLILQGQSLTHDFCLTLKRLKMGAVLNKNVFSANWHGPVDAFIIVPE